MGISTSKEGSLVMSKKNQEVAVLEVAAPAEIVKEPTKRELLRAAKVTVLVSENPKKKGSMSAERFDNYFKLTAGQTVADALKAGVRMDDIRHDSAHGFIQLGDAPVNGRKMLPGDL